MAKRSLTQKAPLLVQAALRQQRAGQPEVAVELYEQALRLSGENAGVLCNLGEACRKLGRFERAVTVLERAARLEPLLAPVHYNLGLTLDQQGKVDEALLSYARALELEPDLPDLLAFFLEGLRELGAYDRALAAHARFAPFVTDSVRLRRAIANVLLDVFQVDEAISQLLAALKLDPTAAEALADLAAAHIERGEAEAALAALRQSLALEPSQLRAHASLVYLLPFAASTSSRDILDEARRFEVKHAQTVPHHSGHRIPSPDEPLRVGYLSADFREHPTALFVSELFRHHDPSRVELFCYSSVTRPDTTTAGLLALADTARDIARLTDKATAQQIFDDGIDVLVDLAMHTGQSRPLVFARKPAKVQVCWLAYPGTTGLSAMDYRLTDPFMDPTQPNEQYSEQSAYLDSFWCFTPPATDPEPSPLPALRNGFPTFGCLHSFKKASPEALELWAAALCAVPEARLVVVAPAGESEARLLRTLAAHGVAPSRVDVVRHAPRRTYLEHFARMDCCLDTWPYGGGTSSLDAYWMGVPVLTLLGKTVAGRSGACLAGHLDLPELVASTPADFAERARALTLDIARLAELRTSLRPRLQASRLMDAPKFARNMERVLRELATQPSAPGEPKAR